MSILEKRIYFLRDIQQEYIPKKYIIAPKKKDKMDSKIITYKTLFIKIRNNNN